MKKSVCMFVSLATALAFASSVMAEEDNSDQARAGRSACHDDAVKFCSSVKPGEGRIIQCLKDHSKEVSDPCYDILEKFAGRKKGEGVNGSDSAPSQ